MSEKQVNTGSVWWKLLLMLIPIILGFANDKIRPLWNKYVAPIWKKLFGGTGEYPEQMLQGIVDLILNFIGREETENPEPKYLDTKKLEELNTLKLRNVTSKVSHVISPQELLFINSKWGSVEKAVKSVYAANKSSIEKNRIKP